MSFVEAEVWKTFFYTQVVIKSYYTVISLLLEPFEQLITPNDQNQHVLFSIKAACIAEDANLASIRNKLENDIIVGLITAAGNEQTAWIGLHDAITVNK